MKNILITSIGCAPASIIARTLYEQSDYYLFGIDIQDECVGNFITNVYIKCPRLVAENYWDFVRDIIKNNNIKYVFVTNNLETLMWSKKKQEFLELYNCEIFLNNEDIVELCDNKLKTYDWCISNDIMIPKIIDINSNLPKIIKPISGCGANGIKIIKNNEDISNISLNLNNCIIQEFISGDEYTVDVLSDKNGNVINIIPKKRMLIKNGQSFKSKICMDDKIIDFVRNVSTKLHNKSAINVQVIKDDKTNIIYLIEINPRWATTVGLTIQAGVHMPQMLIENDFTPKSVKDGLIMIRDYKEYFI